MRKTLLLALGLAGSLLSGPAPAADPENTLILELASGPVVIEMRPDLAPKHVARIQELVRKGFYDGLTFHRVIEGFMAQTGDPLGNGTGGSGTKLAAEFSKEPFDRGSVGMARSRDPDSADSQFFICLGPSSWLDGQYTYWGRVVEGMEHVDAIKKGDRAKNGAVTDPDRIVSMKVAADVK
jgi:peptidylprolyl isomerase